MRWIQHIAAYVTDLLRGLNHKKKEDPSTYGDEFFGYEAFSSQCYCHDLAPKNSETIQG
jgi:hypothetical protein